METNNFKKNTTYDINFLKAEDLNAKPTISVIKNPHLNRDLALITSLYSLEPDMTPEVAEYFRKKAERMREKENERYASAFEKMTDIHVLHELNSNPENNKIIINEKIV